MPKLKLDIFGPNESREKPELTPAVTPAKPKPKQTQAPPDQGFARTRQDKNPSREPSPKFVPVGFHAEHLQLLDDAVFELRRRNIYIASKSGIIRLLIELHRNDLVDIWLSRTKERRGT